ncbi:hypothetical protein Tco_1412453 [Tanacetum coccineum]
MRSERTIKPTQIFDNSINTTSRNKNKQKIVTKNNKNISEHVNGTVECDGNSEFVINTEKEGCNGSMRSDDDVRTEENEVMSGIQDDAPLKDVTNASNGTNLYDNSANTSTNSDNNDNSDEIVKDSDEITSNVNDKQNSYAKTLTKSLNVDGNRLFVVPTSINNKGEEVVLFDEELIRLYNVPLEAWSIKGISTISSRLGRPIMMDQITLVMCKEGSGRFGYARVLVKVDASKSLLDKV